MLDWWHVISAMFVAGAVVSTAWLREQDPIIWFVLGLAAFVLMIFMFERMSAYRHRRASTGLQKTEKPERTDHWTEREQLEISILANVSDGLDPYNSPIDSDPALSRLRELKDAILTDGIDASINGERPNVKSTVSLKSFKQYVAATNKPYWVEVLQRWEARQKRDQKPKEPDVPELPTTLKELYKTDFPECLKQSGSYMFEAKDKPDEIEVLWSINNNQSAGTKFVSFFVPNHHGHTYDVCVTLLEKVDEILTSSDNVKITAMIPGDATHTELNDFPFSGRVYIYHEAMMTLEQLGAVEALYRTKGWRIQFRGQSYATVRWLQERGD